MDYPIPQWKNFYIHSDKLFKAFSHIQALKAELTSKKNQTQSIKIVASGLDMPHEESYNNRYKVKDDCITIENYEDIFTKQEGNGKETTLVDLSQLRSILMYIEKNVDLQMETLNFFVSEHIKFYMTRTKQINNHLEYLSKAIEQNRKLLQKMKDNNEAYDRVKNTDQGSLDSSTDELMVPLIDEKAKVYQESKFLEYLNIYEIALKELHKECSHMHKFLIYNSEFLASFNKTYAKILDIVITCISKTNSMRRIMKYSCNELGENEVSSTFYEVKEYISIYQRLQIKQTFEQHISAIEQATEKIEFCFEENYSSKYTDPEITLRELRSNSDISFFSNNQIFMFGFLVGSAVLLIISEIYLCSFFGFQLEYNHNFKSIFPMFRGFFLICLALWVLGINVFVWNSSFINYRLCFRFIDTSSSLYEILNRAALFTLISLIFLLFYILSRSFEIPSIFNNFKDHSNSNVVGEYTLFNDIFPLACYLILIIYLIWPSTSRANFFNFKGRKYFIFLLIECLLSPVFFVIDLFKLLIDCISSSLREFNHSFDQLSCFSFFSYLFILTLNTNEFKHIWLTDLLTSFIGPLRDLEYTVCYLRHYKSDVGEKLYYCHPERIIVLLVGMLPNILRVFQCFRAIVASRSLFPQIINAGKYLFAMLAACLAFFYKSNSDLFFTWLAVAVFSTFYSSYWDIKYDFGFLEPNSSFPLRQQLSYNRKWVYYMIVFINFILRFGWILTTSPELMESFFLYPEFSIGIVYSLELIRRGIWNFIRIEYEHVKLCNDFKVSIDVELPLKIIQNKDDNTLTICDGSEMLLTDKIKKLNDYSQSFTTKQLTLVKSKTAIYKLSEDTTDDERHGLNMRTANLKKSNADEKSNVKLDANIIEFKESLYNAKDSIQKVLKSTKNLKMVRRNTIENSSNKRFQRVATLDEADYKELRSKIKEYINEDETN